MAKIIEDVLVIKLSKLVKDTDESEGVLNEEILTNLETVLGELVSDAMVEIYPANDDK